MLLTIKDKEYGLVWGQLAFEAMEEKYPVEQGGLELIAMIHDESIVKGKQKMLREITFEAIKLWCAKNDTSMDFNYFEFVQWLDELPEGSPEALFIPTDFLASFYNGKNVSDWIQHLRDLINAKDDTSEVDTKSKKKDTTTRERKSSKTATNGGSRVKSTTT